jgi:hypothetical protein
MKGMHDRSSRMCTAARAGKTSKVNLVTDKAMEGVGKAKRPTTSSYLAEGITRSRVMSKPITLQVTPISTKVTKPA